MDQEEREKATMQLERIAECQAKEKHLGRKLRGHKPKKPNVSVLIEKKRCDRSGQLHHDNMGLKDSRVQRPGCGDASSEMTLATLSAEVTQEKNDIRQLYPMLQKANLPTQRFDQPITATMGRYRGPTPAFPEKLFSVSILVNTRRLSRKNRTELFSLCLYLGLTCIRPSSVLGDSTILSLNKIGFHAYNPQISKKKDNTPPTFFQYKEKG